MPSATEIQSSSYQLKASLRNRVGVKPGIPGSVSGQRAKRLASAFAIVKLHRGITTMDAASFSAFDFRTPVVARHASSVAHFAVSVTVVPRRLAS
jgi:hypothetical protein